MQKENNFELLILNKIYKTDVFSLDINIKTEKNEDIANNIFHLFKKFISTISNSLLNEFIENELINFINISNFLSDPTNKDCFKLFCELNNILKIEKTFSFDSILNKNELYKLIPKISEYGFIDVIIFSALYNCKLWANLYKPKAKPENRNNKIENLSIFFEKFEFNFSNFLIYRFNVTMLSAKHRRKQEKLSRQKKSNPDFISAIYSENIPKVMEMLKSGVSIDSIDQKDKKSAGHIACKIGNINICEILDQYSFDWECIDQDNLTPLFSAVEGQNLEILKFLNFKKVNVEHYDFQKRTAFYHACCLGNLSIVDYMYSEMHCQIDIKSHKGRTPLSKSCYLGKYKIVEYLLNLPEIIDINFIDDRGRTALHNASWGSEGGKLGKLLKGKIEKDCPEAAEILIKKGALIEIEDFEGNTPFAVAAASAGYDTLSLLKIYGANVNARNKKGETPLFQACKYGHLGISKILIEKMNADFLIENNEGTSIIEIAIYNDCFEIYCYLIEFINYYQRVIDCIVFNCSKNHIKRYLDHFIELKKIKNFDLIFKNNYIEPLSEIENESFLLELLFCFKLQLNNENKDNLLYNFLFKEKKYSFIKNYLKFEEDYFSKNNLNYEKITIFLRNKDEIDNNLWELLVLQTNLDIFSIKFPFFYLLVDKRQTELILNLIKILKNDKISKLVTNKFLQNIHIESKKQLLLQKNESNNLNCLELSQIRKYSELYKILHEYSHFLFNKIENAYEEQYHIPRYELIELPEETYIHLQKNEIELMNQEILNSNKAIQYLQINEKEKKIMEIHHKIEITNDLYNKRELFIVYTENELKKITNLILKYSIIGVDLEYNVEKSNLGFVSVLQISTINHDIIIDSLKLRKYISVELKEIFENKKIIKLFHGCDSDLQFLKVDYDFNIVNIFDTAKAYMLLNSDKSLVSLAFLTSKYLNFVLDKQYQTSDWRIRPLPKFMIEYARKDSATLIYLFNFLFKDLEKERKINEMALSCNKFTCEKIEKCHFKKNLLILKE